MADPQKLARAFDLMIIGLTDAGCTQETVTKFLQRARADLGIPQEDSPKTRMKIEMAQLASEVLTDEPPLDGRSKAARELKARRASEDGPPN